MAAEVVSIDAQFVLGAFATSIILGLIIIVMGIRARKHGSRSRID
jgi:hypothetical protein